MISPLLVCEFNIYLHTFEKYLVTTEKGTSTLSPAIPLTRLGDLSLKYSAFETVETTSCVIFSVLIIQKKNPFLSINFIKLATVLERQAPPIHSRPSLVVSLIKLILKNGFCFLRNCVRKKMYNESTYYDNTILITIQSFINTLNYHHISLPQLLSFAAWHWKYTRENYYNTDFAHQLLAHSEGSQWQCK